MTRQTWVTLIACVKSASASKGMMGCPSQPDTVNSKGFPQPDTEAQCVFFFFFPSEPVVRDRLHVALTHTEWKKQGFPLQAISASSCSILLLLTGPWASKTFSSHTVQRQSLAFINKSRIICSLSVRFFYLDLTVTVIFFWWWTNIRFGVVWWCYRLLSLQARRHLCCTIFR